MIRTNAEVTFDFGKHEGATIQQVFEEDPQYLYWVLKNSGYEWIKAKIRGFFIDKGIEFKHIVEF